jgi:hypothetical protein
MLALICSLPTTSSYLPVRDECPRVTIECPDGVAASGVPLTFSANISGGDPTITYTFKWTVSAGTIMSGQDTSSITVDTTGLVGGAMTATVDVGGLPEPCVRSASCSLQLAYLCIFPRKVDEYGNLSPSDERARLDNFAVELKNDPESVGYIVSYAGRRAVANEARAERARSYLIGKHEVGAGRVVIIDGGHREERTIELWVLPHEAAAPSASPTVDPSEVITIRGGRAKSRTRRP